MAGCGGEQGRNIHAGQVASVAGTKQQSSRAPVSSGVGSYCVTVWHKTTPSRLKGYGTVTDLLTILLCSAPEGTACIAAVEALTFPCECLLHSPGHQAGSLMPAQTLLASGRTAMSLSAVAEPAKAMGDGRSCFPHRQPRRLSRTALRNTKHCEESGRKLSNELVQPALALHSLSCARRPRKGFAESCPQYMSQHASVDGLRRASAFQAAFSSWSGMPSGCALHESLHKTALRLRGLPV